MSRICFAGAFLVSMISTAYWGEHGRFGFALSDLLLGILAARLLADSVGITPPSERKR